MDGPMAFVVLRTTEKVKVRTPINLTMLTLELRNVSLEVRTTAGPRSQILCGV